MRESVHSAHVIHMSNSCVSVLSLICSSWGVSRLLQITMKATQLLSLALLLWFVLPQECGTGRKVPKTAKTSKVWKACKLKHSLADRAPAAEEDDADGNDSDGDESLFSHGIVLSGLAALAVVVGAKARECKLC